MAFNDGIIVGISSGGTLQFAKFNYRPTISSHTVLPCSLPSNCILSLPATPNCVVDVSPLECVYGMGEGVGVMVKSERCCLAHRKASLSELGGSSFDHMKIVRVKLRVNLI